MSAALWDRLRAEQLVEGDCPQPGRPASPWYVRAMLGIAGWIGALFLLLFVGAAFTFIMNDAASAFILGIVCCAAAFALFQIFDGNDFAEQFGLAVSLAGQVLIVIGLAQAFRPEHPPLYFAIAATQAVLMLAVPNFLHRVLAATGTALALALGINQLSLHGLAAPLLCLGLAWIWLDPARWAADGRLWRPAGYGLALALLLIETFRLFGVQSWLGIVGRTPSWMELYGPLIGRGLSAAILVWIALALTRFRSDAAPGHLTLFAVAAALVFGLLSLQAPGLASAVAILLLGFAAGNRILMILGILALLGFVSHFYYSLHATLLEKSGLLAVTGLCLLAAHFGLRRLAPAADAQEVGHA